MVNVLHIGALASQFLIVAENEVGPALERMTPHQRAAVIMALLALTLIGLFLIGFVMVGGHWVRRLARHRPGGGHVETNAGENRSAENEMPKIQAEHNTDDTVLLNRPSKDTTVDG